MRTGTGQPQRIAVVGASSEIAQAAVLALVAAGGVEHALLSARDPATLDSFVGDLGSRGVAASAIAWDATGSDASGAGLVDALWAGGDLDLLLVAVGQLPVQTEVEADLDRFDALVQANFTAPAAVGLRAAERMRQQAHGMLVVVSSVSAERPRGDTYLYGATKAGLDALYTGLGERLHGSGVTVVVVRPGFVHTRMTTGLDPAPFATTPEKVGADIAAAVAAGVSKTVWSPAPLRGVMSVLRHLPRPVFRKLAASRE